MRRTRRRERGGRKKEGRREREGYNSYVDRILLLNVHAAMKGERYHHSLSVKIPTGAELLATSACMGAHLGSCCIYNKYVTH